MKDLKLVVSNIYKSYNSVPILKGCSFSFGGRGIYVLIGPNGSGKSTFFRICALLEEPDSGDIKFFSGDETIRRDINLRRRISLVLPKVGIFNTSVFQNIAYGLRIRGLNKKEINEKVEQVLELVGLHHKVKDNALALSSGEAQRLGIARALVLEPEILFLDEPTVSLDPHSTKIIEETIRKIKDNNKTTIIMITHSVFQAKRLADTVLFMYEGRIVEHGANKEFFKKPKDENAYRFITGQMIY